jgi:hypothetical protein
LSRCGLQDGRGHEGIWCNGGTKSSRAPSVGADSIKQRVTDTAANANGKDEAKKGAATGAPTKVVPGAGEELPRLEQGAERTETVAATRVASASQTEGPLW